mmetsp:Transcript_22974/g.49712  ORF Transcript_22974/g.49712 Transcript_22974/m.49712 type:complete len:571 (-) Transcript_22974:23-1735(-)
MKTILQVLLAHAIYAEGSQSQVSRCVELNFQAASLQSGDSCTLFNTVINSGDILAGDITDVHTTCGEHLENVDHPYCVEDVVDVVAGIIDEGCEVTGGTTVANFIYTLNDNNEAFASLTELACRGQGECFADIQKAIEYCNDNPTEEDCMNYLTCDCLVDLISVIESLSETGKEDFLKLDAATIEKIQEASTTCRCDDLNSRALSAELGPSCALSNQIVKDGDILAGDTAVLAETCNATTEKNCVEDIVDIVGGFIEYYCPVTYANGPFIYSLHDSSEDYSAITDFACNTDCYLELRTCQNDKSCVESLSCDCMRDFLAIVEDLSPDSKEDLLKLDTSTIDQMQQAVGKCICDELNDKAADLQNESYCALHNSIVKEGFIFAGDSSDILSTCAERHACVGNVTETIAQISDLGCEIKQDTDYLAKFLYTVNNSSDFNVMTNFICNSGETLLFEPNDGCYDEVKVIVEGCKTNATDNCPESAKSDCLYTFIDMVERLSDDAKDDILGIDSALLGKIEQLQNATSNESASSNETTPSNEAQPNTPSQLSGAVFYDASMAAISYVVSIAFLLL